MHPVIAFDVYGTLIDTQGVTAELEKRLEEPGKVGEALPDHLQQW